MAEVQTKNWLSQFGEIMGGATETVRNVADTIKVLTENAGQDLPPTVEDILEQMKNQEDVQGEVKTPAARSFGDSPWLPIAVIGLLIILMVK